MPNQRKLKKWENLPTDFLNCVRKHMGEDFFKGLNPKITLPNLPTTRLWRRIGDWVQNLENARGLKVNLDVYWNEVPPDINAALIADIFCQSICELCRSINSELNLSDQDVYNTWKSRPELRAAFLFNMNSFMMSVSEATSGIYGEFFRISRSDLPDDSENITRGFDNLLIKDPQLEKMMKNWQIEGMDKPIDESPIS